MTPRRRFFIASLALVLIAAWAVIAFRVGPGEIARAHRGDSWPFLNDLLAGRHRIPLEEYLADWRYLALRIGWGLVASLALGYATLELLSSGPGRRVRRTMRGRLARARRQTSEWPLGGLTAFAIWLGLVTGLAEATYSVIEQQSAAAGRMTPLRHGWEGLWMAPAVNATLLALAAAMLHLPRRRWRTFPPDRWLIFFLSALALFGLARRFVPGVHGLAALLLAAGIGAQLARRLVARPRRWRGFVRRSAVGLAVALAGWTLLAHAAGRRAEMRRLAALPPAEAASPNVLLIVLDTVRAASMSLHGYERPTSPSIDRIAGAGTVFAKAVATAPWTLPSHASMFTGRWAHELSADWDSPLDDTHPTLAEWFAEHGYATAGFVANTVYCGRGVGLQRGFHHYDDRANSLGRVLGSSWLGNRVLWFLLRRGHRSQQWLLRVRASEIREEFTGWLEDRPEPESGRHAPFFAFLNLFDAHAPYLPPEPYDERFARPGARYWLGPPGTAYSERAARDLVDAYDGSIAYVDHEVGLLLRELSRSGALDDTILLITSDHGEEFGEHGVWEHGQSLYLPSLHVPLIVVWPGRVPRGLIVEDPVSLRDLPATLTHLVSGAQDPRFPGASLAAHWSARAAEDAVGSESRDPLAIPPRPTGARRRAEPTAGLLSRVSSREFLPEDAPAGRGDVESILLDGLHYIRVADGGEELYDIRVDPWERSELGATRAQAMRRLARLLSMATRGPGSR